MKLFGLVLPYILTFSLFLSACNSDGNMIKSKLDSSSKSSTSESISSTNEPSKGNNSSVNFKLEVGDKLNYFKISIEATPIAVNNNDSYDNNLKILIYNLKDTSKPYQIIDDGNNGNNYQDYKLEDVNFDGYLDFYYVSGRGTVNIYYCFWIWNPKSEVFIKSKELNEISLPSFDKNTDIISGYNRSSAASNTKTYYKYINGILTCVRILDMGQPNENNYQILTVQDYVDGKLVEVFRNETILTDKFEGKIYDEFFQWGDLNYK